MTMMLSIQLTRQMSLKMDQNLKLLLRKRRKNKRRKRKKMLKLWSLCPKFQQRIPIDLMQSRKKY